MKEKSVSRIRFYASVFRKALEDCRFHAEDTEIEQIRNFPKGCCKLSSQLLARYLFEECRIVKSSIKFACNGRRKRSPKTRCWIRTKKRARNAESHVWIEVDEIIVDITADQFQDQLSAVIVTKKRDWHELFFGYEYFDYSALMQMNDNYLNDFDTFYHYVNENLVEHNF